MDPYLLRTRGLKEREGKEGGSCQEIVVVARPCLELRRSWSAGDSTFSKPDKRKINPAIGRRMKDWKV